MLLLSSDKAIKLLKEWLYINFSDPNEQPSAQDSASLRQGKWYFALSWRAMLGIIHLHIHLLLVRRPVKKLNELARLYWF